jgi:hypothetical protein
VCGCVFGVRDSAARGLVDILTLTSTPEICLVINAGCPKDLLAFPPFLHHASGVIGKLASGNLKLKRLCPDLRTLFS